MTVAGSQAGVLTLPNRIQSLHRHMQSELGMVPADWELAPVSSKGQILTGKALAVNAPGKQRPYLRTKNVFDGYIDIEDVLTMPMTDAQFDHFKVLAGDVLLNEGQSLELVGRCAMYGGEYPEPCAMQNQLLRFRAGAGVSAEFATHLFRYCQGTGVFARIALQTTSIAHLGGTRFERLSLPWPGIDEQRAIAGALSDVDALISALDKLIVKKHAIKMATTQQLLSGKSRLPEFKGPTKGSEIGTIPSTWDTPKLADLFMFKNGLNKGKEFFGHGTPIVNYMDVYRLRGLRKENLRGCVSVSATERKNFEVRKGDVFFTRTSETAAEVGISSVMLEDVENTVFSGFVLRARPKDDSLDDSFKKYCFSTDSVRKQITSQTTETTRALTNGRVLGTVIIARPPIGEQHAIASVLADMEADIAALERRREKTKAIKQGMMQALLTGRVRLQQPEAVGA